MVYSICGFLRTMVQTALKSNYNNCQQPKGWYSTGKSNLHHLNLVSVLKNHWKTHNFILEIRGQEALLSASLCLSARLPKQEGGKVKRINSVKGCGALQNSQCRAGFSAALPCSQTCSKRLTSVHTFSGDKHTARTRAIHSDYFFYKLITMKC